MESYQSTFLRFDHGSPYNAFLNGISWSPNNYPSTLPLTYSCESGNHPTFKTQYPAYDTLSTKYPLDSPEQQDASTITSTYIQPPKEHFHSLFGDPSVLLNQLIDEFEDSSSNPQLANIHSTIYNFKSENPHVFHESETNGITTSPPNEIHNPYNSHEEQEAPPSNYDSIQDQFQQFRTTSPIFSHTERPRQINKNRGAQISAQGLSSPLEDASHIKHNSLSLENDNENDQFEPDLEMLLKQMDRKEFQECWSKDWTLGLIRFCKYMQLSEKMQIGPAIKLKTDDNKCVILVLKKIFQAKPPSGWPNYGVRLQIQCGGYIQDILAWSNISRETWKTIMPLIAKGITQLIKKVGGVHKLRNGHQPYFNACRNALREDVTLYSLLKEYSRGVNTKKKRQSLAETENKELHND